MLGFSASLQSAMKSAKARWKARVADARLVDALLQALRNLRHLAGEARHGLLEVAEFLNFMAVEGAEQVGQFRPLAAVGLQHAALVLVEDGRVGVLEDDVAEGITALALAPDLNLKVVAAVLGLPEAVLQPPLVAQGAVRNHAALAQLFEQERPVAVLFGLSRAAYAPKALRSSLS